MSERMLIIEAHERSALVVVVLHYRIGIPQSKHLGKCELVILTVILGVMNSGTSEVI